jgi:hypothetical protein
MEEKEVDFNTKNNDLMIWRKLNFPLCSLRNNVWNHSMVEFKFIYYYFTNIKLAIVPPLTLYTIVYCIL